MMAAPQRIEAGMDARAEAPDTPRAALCREAMLSRGAKTYVWSKYPLM